MEIQRSSFKSGLVVLAGLATFDNGRAQGQQGVTGVLERTVASQAFAVQEDLEDARLLQDA